MSDAPGVRLWGLRFTSPETEQAYRAWERVRAVPFVRLGMAGSVLSWTLAMIGFGVAAPAIAGEMIPWLGLLTPVVLLALACTWFPRFYAALYPLTAAANAIAGLAASAPAFAAGDLYVAMSVAGVVVIGYFAFTIFRLPLGWAVAAALPYFGSFALRLLVAPEGALLTWDARTLMLTVLAVALSSGALTCAVLELDSRRAFSQEKTIAAQRETIERLLKQEISHQVAERSRALSETLAKVDTTLPAARLEPGRPFASRYVVVRPLGKGGMGAVYEVERATDGQRLALKVITTHVSGAQAARFAREAEIGARVRHPNLVPIVDVGISPDGAPFLVMELIEGSSLEELRGRFGDAGWARPMLRQVAEGLRALHAAGVVHRDLKPANVLVSGDRARISDFGISRVDSLPATDVDPLGATAAPSAEERLTRTGMLIGTPLYMAPEAARGGQAIEAPADVFAFGLIAYELLTGRFPFPTAPVMEVMAGRPMPTPAPLEGPLSTLVLACLAADPRARPPVEALRAALDPASRG